MRYILITLLLFPFSACVVVKKQKSNDVDYKDVYFRQYTYLLEQSVEYDFINKKFKYEVQGFIDTVSEYMQGHFIKPFTINSVRGGSILLYPYFFNSKQDRVILMILNRKMTLSNKPVEKIRFVLGKKENDNWIFSIKKGYVRSFSYENAYPLLSDTDMSLRILRNFIDWGYMPLDEVKINDKFFDKDW